MKPKSNASATPRRLIKWSITILAFATVALFISALVEKSSFEPVEIKFSATTAPKLFPQLLISNRTSRDIMADLNFQILQGTNWTPTSSNHMLYVLNPHDQGALDLNKFGLPTNKWRVIVTSSELEPGLFSLLRQLELNLIHNHILPKTSTINRRLSWQGVFESTNSPSK